MQRQQRHSTSKMFYLNNVFPDDYGPIKMYFETNYTTKILLMTFYMLKHIPIFKTTDLAFNFEEKLQNF